MKNLRKNKNTHKKKLARPPLRLRTRKSEERVGGICVSRSRLYSSGEVLLAVGRGEPPGVVRRVPGHAVRTWQDAAVLQAGDTAFLRGFEKKLEKPRKTNEKLRKTMKNISAGPFRGHQAG